MIFQWFNAREAAQAIASDMADQYSQRTSTATEPSPRAPPQDGAAALQNLFAVRKPMIDLQASTSSRRQSSRTRSNGGCWKMALSLGLPTASLTHCSCIFRAAQ